MKKASLLSFLFILLLVKHSNGQNYSSIIFTASENTADSVIFQNCLDSIIKYVYLDSRKIEPYTKICDQMLNQPTELSNRHRFEYVIQRIYNEFNYKNILGVLEIIETNRKMLDEEGVLPEQKNQFKYLNGYTLLLIGEVGTAQEVFFELLDHAKEKRDSSLMMQSMSSLGKLFGMQNDFVSGEKYTLEFLKLIPEDKPVHKVNGYFELIRLYLESKQIDKAEYYNQVALHLVDSLSLVDFQVDFLLQKVSISLEKDKPDIAMDAYRKASMVANEIGNPNYQQLCKLSYAEILEFQKRYGEALSLFEQSIKDNEEGEVVLTELLAYYQSASKIADKKGDFEKAFRYILKANELGDSLSTEEQKAKSKFLLIKFDAEQREKENALLSAQILQKQSQNRFLYAVIALFLIATLFLIAAFFQKRNYNKLLESEVSNRTIELENANKSLQNLNIQLREFNNILSHDLKEPLRSIVGFSEMATRELSSVNGIQSDRVIKYLDYVKKGGKQLNVLIDDVSQFQSISEPLPEDLKLVDVNLVIESILESIQYLLQDKEVVVKFENLPRIYSYNTLLFLIFKNLIENGIKFNNSSKPTILIKYEQSDDFHVFLVQDNGVGIAPKYHDRVFGMFKRLHDRRVYEGSGLGLNIVKKIVDKLGGSVGIIESDENKGSLFQVSLPILKAQ